ncbi:MAG: cell division ATP-binding protein FtsE [Acidobacteria bacterium]|nr:cell division ATP-binding protein FtsE [Acidobacteriota bacterium]
MIRLLHVFKQFRPGMYALEDVNLRLEKGEFAFLTGPSGAGKTTLLRLLLREEKPTRGQVLIQGKSIVNLPAGKIPYLRRNIGVVFQDFKLLPRKTVFENIAFVLEIVGIVGLAQRTRTREVIRDLGLYDQRNAYPEELSGGEKQRTAIARAIVNRPAILLADEPTGNLDPDLSRDILQLFKSIHLFGTTVLVATHDLELIRSFPRRVIRLDGGRLVADTDTLDRRSVPLSI